MDSFVLDEGVAISVDCNGRDKASEELSRSGVDGNKSTEYLSVDEMLVKHVGEFGKAQFWHFVLVSLAWTMDALNTMVMVFGDRVPEWRCLPENGTGDQAANWCSESSSMCELDRSAWEWVGGRSRSIVSEWDLTCGEEYKVGLVGSLFFLGLLIGPGIYGHLSDSLLGRKGALTLSCMSAAALGLLTSIAPSYWIYAVLRFGTGLNCGGIGLCCFVLATEIVGPNKRGAVGMSAFYFFSGGIMLLPFLSYFSPSWRFLYTITAIPGIAYCAFVLPFMWESPRWYLVKGRVDDAMNVLRVFAKRNGTAIPETAHLQLDDVEEEEEEDDDDEKRNVRPIVTSNESGPAVNQSASLTAPLIIADRQTNSSPARVEEGNHCSTVLSTKLQPKNCKQAEGTLVDVFRYGKTRVRMILMICIWLFMGVVYYGISLNVVNLGFNLYVGVFLNAFIEWPAFAITAMLLDKVGRRTMLVVAMALSGVCCLLGSLIFVWQPPDHSSGLNGSYLTSDSPKIIDSNTGLKSDSWDRIGMLRLACGVVGIFGMAATYNLVYIYTMELFPTVVRNAALGLASQAAGIGSVTAPIIVVLGQFVPFLPFLAFGILALAGAGLATLLPETLHEHLHETMEGMQRNDKLAKLPLSEPEKDSRLEPACTVDVEKSATEGTLRCNSSMFEIIR